MPYKAPRTLIGSCPALARDAPALWGKASACLNPPFTESTTCYPVFSLTGVSFSANPQNCLKKPLISGVRVTWFLQSHST